MMPVSGRKEFDMKQILRLRWKWFSHPSQGSSGNTGCLQQEGFEHRGMGQNRLKSHSRDRNGLRKNSSPISSLLAPVPGPVYNRPDSQPCHQLNIVSRTPENEGLSQIPAPDDSLKEEEKENKETREADGADLTDESGER